MKSQAIIAAAALLSLSAPAVAAPREQLVIGVSQFPSTLHPAIDAEVIKAYVLGFALRPISAFDAGWQNTCLQCAVLPSLANGLARLEGRGMAVTVKLKPGLVWGDGVKVTARDLAFTWTLGHDPASGFADLSYWQRIGSVEVIDERTAVMHLNKVWAQFDRLPTMLPAHLEAAAAEAAKEPGDYARHSLYARAPTTPGLYNGPYLVTQYNSGAQVVLEANPDWRGAKPGFKRIVIRAIENTAALKANLQSGDVDYGAGRRAVA